MNFSSRVLADSVNPAGCRLTTLEVTYPRFIHAEILTHRSHSRNSASSRAIPVNKLLERIENHPVIPLHWGKNQSGMQAYEVLTPFEESECQRIWLEARDDAVRHAKALMALGLHKQIANRLLEPFMWITVILSATDWRHFYALRCHEAAEPHFQKIAGMMRETMAASTPKQLAAGEWHLPLTGFPGDEALSLEDLIKVSTARCARVSYLTHNNERDVQADIDLHDRLHTGNHWSPFEHVAETLQSNMRHGNFKGFRQYRKFFPLEFLQDDRYVI
jgi:thymidylate synthase ThyX